MSVLGATKCLDHSSSPICVASIANRASDHGLVAEPTPTNQSLRPPRASTYTLAPPSTLPSRGPARSDNHTSSQCSTTVCQPAATGRSVIAPTGARYPCVDTRSSRAYAVPGASASGSMTTSPHTTRAGIWCRASAPVAGRPSRSHARPCAGHENPATPFVNRCTSASAPRTTSTGRPASSSARTSPRAGRSRS